MTGRRKYRGKPLAVEATARNSHRMFEQRMARAVTRREKLAIMWDYYRGALVHAERVAPSDATRETEEIMANLAERTHRLQSATVARSRNVKVERE
jgi:glutamate-1-semialdehyde aminotransferase